MRSIVVVGLLGLVLSGCGETTGTAEGRPGPITPRAIAAITLDHVSDDTDDRGAMFTGDGLVPKGLVGAELRYGAEAGDDGDLLRVAVVPGEPESDPCETSECVELETDVEGAEMLLRWEELAPEEDPGIVSVLLQRDGEYAYAYSSGPAITGDPRELDLSIGVGDLVAIVEDPRLRLVTTREALEAGEALDDWESEEPESDAGAATRATADLTDRAVALLATDRLVDVPGVPEVVAARPLENRPEGAVGTELELEDTKAMVRVWVAPSASGDPCTGAGCVNELAEGGRILFGENDLGSVVLLRLDEGQSVVVQGVGDELTTDDLIWVLDEPDLRLRTTDAAVQAGESFPLWEG